MNKEYIKNKLNEFGLINEPFLFVISYDFSKFYIEKLSNLPKNIKYKIDDKSKATSNKVTKIEKYPLNFNEYEKKFNLIKEEIKKGNSYLLNFTAKTKIKTNLSLNEIYEKVNAKFKLRYQKENDNFVCFSPERFIQIKENKIYTFPMKGTIDSNIENAEEKILADKKEMAEHTMVVDLLRNDLGIIGRNVNVDKFRYVEEINAGEKKLLQISSKISADLEKDWNTKIGTILTSILPAGSITGTPKKKTVEILEELEDYDRDFYTGIFGVYENGRLDSAVMIRFIEENTNKEQFYKSGGGVTYDSLVKNEYEELIDKIYLPF